MISRESIKVALERVRMITILGKSASVLLAFLAGELATGLFHGTTPYWGALLSSVTAIVTFRDDNLHDTIHAGWLMLIGSFIGVIIASSYLALFNFSILGLIITLSLLSAICMIINDPENGKRAAIVMVWVFVRSQFNDISPFANGLMRFIESSVGVISGVLVAWVVTMINNRKKY